MKRKLPVAKRLPQNVSDDEFARFVETHDLGEIMKKSHLLRDDIGTGKLRPKLIRLPDDVLQLTTKIAPRRGLDQTSLIRSYVVEGVRRDLATGR